LINQLLRKMKIWIILSLSLNRNKQSHASANPA